MPLDDAEAGRGCGGGGVLNGVVMVLLGCFSRGGSGVGKYCCRAVCGLGFISSGMGVGARIGPLDELAIDRALCTASSRARARWLSCSVLRCLAASIPAFNRLMNGWPVFGFRSASRSVGLYQLSVLSLF